MRFLEKYNYHVNKTKSNLIPFVFDENRYNDSFLRYHSEVIPNINTSFLQRRVFVFWTGDNNLTTNRKRNLKVLEETIEIEVVLITPKNLLDYILPDYPLHPAYPYLSLVHKSDYLRCYFMNFYGGGYSDIKAPQYSWLSLFDKFEKDDSYIIGYPETKKQDLAQVGGLIQKDLDKYYSQIIGNCAYICRPNTPFTNDWYSELLVRMDKYTDELYSYPGNVLGDNIGYPIPWTNILGDIFHPLCLKYMDKICQDNRFRPICKNYR